MTRVTPSETCPPRTWGRFPILAADWTPATLDGKPFASEKWYEAIGHIVKAPP